MNPFVNVCVTIVMAMLIMAITGIMSFISGTKDLFLGWLISSFGFAICLTAILMNTGII